MQQRSFHNTSSILITALVQAGVDPVRFHKLLSRCIDAEEHVFEVTEHVLPDNEINERRLAIIEGQILCLLLES